MIDIQSNLQDVVIVGASRTPIGDLLGSLKNVSAVDLGVIAANSAIARAGIKPEQIQDVVGGMVYKAGAKGNPARQIQLKVGIPVEAGAVTVDQQCGSGMRALEIAAQQIMLGKSEISLAVGIESMSQAPYLVLKAREGIRMGNDIMVDSLLHDALVDPFCNYHMGMTAENLAEKYSISRVEQDELAYLSHQRAMAAINGGKFKDEIVPVEIQTKKGVKIVDTDEHPRDDISIDKLAKLRTAFKKEGGTVTAGNASGVNDGAAALVLMSAQKANELGIKPLAKILATTSFGVAPEIMGIGPAYAIPKALKYANLSLADIDYFEINEAFAAQFLAVNRELKLDMEKVNANGSGIALGHPVGCSGIRIIVTLLYEMARRDARYGVASLCVGGGPAIATVLEKIK